MAMVAVGLEGEVVERAEIGVAEREEDLVPPSQS